MKLCVFQGTFNPIHNAHLRVGEFVLATYKPDLFFYIPAKNPPHKFCNPSLAQHRFNMVKLATESNPRFSVSDIEYKRKGKSYTYLTICELYKKYDIDGKILFIIGTDAFKKIENWYEFDKLKKLVKFILFVREDNFNPLEYNYFKEIGLDFEIQPLPYKEISSTELREKIKAGENITSLVHPKVKEYIEQNGLYKD
jgi:nicotinate-nucleotide adenylyltransferase